MAEVTITEASRHFGYKTTSVIQRLVKNGRLSDHAVVTKKGQKLLKLEGLKKSVAGLIQQRRSNISYRKPPEIDIETCSRMADAANALMDEMGWLVSSPSTMAEWSLFYVAMEKARKAQW